MCHFPQKSETVGRRSYSPYLNPFGLAEPKAVEEPGVLWAAEVWCQFLNCGQLASLETCPLTGAGPLSMWAPLESVTRTSHCHPESSGERGASQNPFGKHFTNVTMRNNQGGWCSPHQGLKKRQRNNKLPDK